MGVGVGGERGGSTGSSSAEISKVRRKAIPALAARGISLFYSQYQSEGRRSKGEKKDEAGDREAIETIEVWGGVGDKEGMYLPHSPLRRIDAIWKLQYR